MAAMQGADQHIRGSLGFSILPKDSSTCRPGESNQRPADNKTLAPVLSCSRPVKMFCGRPHDMWGQLQHIHTHHCPCRLHVRCHLEWMLILFTPKTSWCGLRNDHWLKTTTLKQVWSTIGLTQESDPVTHLCVGLRSLCCVCKQASHYLCPSLAMSL